MNIAGPKITFGHEVIHDREHSLFHLAGVLGTKDNHLAAVEIDRHTGFRFHAFDGGVGGLATGVVNHVVRFTKVRQLLFGRANQHVVHKQRVIRA